MSSTTPVGTASGPARQDWKPRRFKPLPHLAIAAVWFLVVGSGLAAVVLARFTVTVPSWLPTAGAVAITTAFVFGLAARTGGRPLISGALALVLSTVAVVSHLPVLVAGAALATAVASAVLAVMATKPAPRFVLVIRECLVAVVIGVIGALAVEAYGAQVSIVRFEYLSLGLSLLAAMGLVYRLGAGLLGLGRRGLVMVLVGLVLLTITMAYTEALTRWGSPGLGESIENLTDLMQSTLGAVPRPVAFLLGFPALAWGVSTRARRRQGWWVCAYGAAGVAGISVCLLDARTSLAEAALSLLYSVVLGLLFGYLIIRADKFLTGPRGRRARQLEEATAHRPEPGRTWPLL